MPTLTEAMEQASISLLADEELITPINNILMINPETREIDLPESEKMLGVKLDKDVESKYFKCPKIVGDNIDLSQHKIYVVYQKTDEQLRTLYDVPCPYWCEDMKVDETGDYITFSWKLSGNVFDNSGFIAFKVVAKYVDSESGTIKTRWNTIPTIGIVKMTLSDGEEIIEQYADIITQLLQKMENVEVIATPEAMQDYVNQYLTEHPVENIARFDGSTGVIEL